MCVDIMEAVLVTNRRAFMKLRISPRGEFIQGLNDRLNFGQHFNKAADKTVKTRVQLSRLIRNVGEPDKTKRRILTTVVQISRFLYSSLIWSEELLKWAVRRTLSSVYRCIALSTVLYSPTKRYRTVRL